MTTASPQPQQSALSVVVSFRPRRCLFKLSAVVVVVVVCGESEEALAERAEKGVCGQFGT